MMHIKNTARDVNSLEMPTPTSSGVETASHAGHCPINVVNVR